jgi:putative colanic acid biosysnthesis UDP-glucose lipid carrier transferase
MMNQHFRQVGVFQQFGGLLIRVGRLIEGFIILLSLYLTVRLFGAAWNEAYLVISLVAVLCFEIVASFFEFYRSWRVVRLRYELLEMFSHWTLTCLLVTFVFYLAGVEGDVRERVGIIYSWYALAFCAMAAFRCFSRLMLRYVRAFGYDGRVACFAGATEVAVQLGETLKRCPWMGVRVRGIFDDRIQGGDRTLAIPREQLAGSIDDLIRLAERNEVDIVYISLPMAAERRIKDFIERFSNSTVSLYYCPSFFEFDLLNGRWDNVFGQPVISVIESPFTGYVGLAKRVQDLFLCALILPAIALPMAAIAILIKATSRGPVLYKQTRYGLDGKEFTIWKFRTMYTCETTDKFVQATKDDPRVTPIGRFLRKTSLDELPQFINVLKGDMSVIGPRPHPIKLDEMHRKNIRRYMLRHKIKPGITGFAQVNGFRGETDTLYKMQKRIEHDLYYIKHWSLWLDVKIFFKTFFAFFFDKNAY